MTHRARLLLILGPTVLAGCAALPAIFGAVSAVAPVAVAAIDAYSAQAQRLAPTATPADQAALATLLANRDTCVVAASHALVTDETPEHKEMAAALKVSADASAKLAAALDRLAMVGKDGGT